MAHIKQEGSKVACFAMLGGMLLLAFAGTLVVMSAPKPLTADLHHEGFLPRRLQATVVVKTISGKLVSETYTNPSVFDSSDGSSSMGDLLESGKSSEPMSLRSLTGDSGKVYHIMAGAFGNAMVQLILMLVFAVCYYRRAVTPILMNYPTLKQRQLPYSGRDDFNQSICGCFEDMWVCIHGLCCPLVRMSHTNAVAGILGFWETACVWFCCSIFTGGLGPCCLMVWWRKQLKEIMGIEDHFINDVCVTMCCPFLSVCQQGAAVDEALGYEVTGCCRVESRGYD